MQFSQIMQVSRRNYSFYVDRRFLLPYASEHKARALGRNSFPGAFVTYKGGNTYDKRT